MLDCVICSADSCPVYYDQYESPESYSWTPERASCAHAYCRKQFADALDKEVALIILDNTNIQNRDFQSYVTKAKAAGYEVAYIEFPPDEAKLEEYAKRNTHKVPKESILKMVKKWETRKS